MNIAYPSSRFWKPTSGLLTIEMTIRVVRKQLLAVSQKYYPKSKNTMNMIAFNTVIAAKLTMTLTPTLVPHGNVEEPLRIKTTSRQISEDLARSAQNQHFLSFDADAS